MAQAPEVAVVGLRALTRDVNRLCENAGDLNRALAQAGKQASQPIASQVAENVPRLTGTLAATIRVTGTRSGAAVRMGTARVPYAGPVDFGGWPTTREYMSDGRYLFPAAQALAGEAAQLYGDAAQHALDSFDWTNTTNDAEGVHD
jgi:hypothetical protein